MGYKPVEKRKYTMEEMAGSEVFVDSRGREWGVRVYTLAELTRFQRLLTGMLLDPCARRLVWFFRHSLVERAPGLRVRARRAMGLPDFSVREISRAFGVSEARELRDRIVRANMDMGFDEFVSRCEESVKKKIVPPDEEAGPEESRPDGEKRGDA
jgi:hypothetical protein